MRRTALIVVVGFAAAVILRGTATVVAQDALDGAFRAYWDADSPSEAARAAERVLASGADFDAVWTRLRAGRTYSPQTAGVQGLATRVGGSLLDNVLDVPAGYDPARPWSLRVQLHGGVGRQPPGRGESARPLTNRIPGEPQLTLHPRAWANSQWWTPQQVDNILGLVDRVKRTYNVDESRVYATGISDGGTGVYYLAMRTASLWSACLPLNGHPAVLANPDVGADGELFIGNLVNCPMYLVNGGRDRLYPADSVAAFVDMMKRAGVPIVFQVYPEAGHDTSWWPTERSQYEAFLAAHGRPAHPADLSWETEQTNLYNRRRLARDRSPRAWSSGRVAGRGQHVRALGRKAGDALPAFRDGRDEWTSRAAETCSRPRHEASGSSRCCCRRMWSTFLGPYGCR